MEFLTKEELIEITGYRRKAEQIRQLKRQNYPIQNFDRFGTPLVLFKDVFGFRRDGQTKSEPEKPKWQPPPP